MNEMLGRIADILMSDGCGESEQCEKTARRVLEALELPTDQMFWAGYQADYGASKTFEEFIYLDPGWREEIGSIWQAMIQEVLK